MTGRPATTDGADAASLADVETIDALPLATLHGATGRREKTGERRRKLAADGKTS